MTNNLSDEIAKQSQLVEGQVNFIKQTDLREAVETILYKMVTTDHQRMDIMPLVWEYADQILSLIPELKVLNDEKPPVLALNQTITWGGKLRKRKIFKKEEIIELVRQLQTDQRNADVSFYQAQLKDKGE